MFKLSIPLSLSEITGLLTRNSSTAGGQLISPSTAFARPHRRYSQPMNIDNEYIIEFVKDQLEKQTLEMGHNIPQTLNIMIY